MIIQYLFATFICSFLVNGRKPKKSAWLFLIGQSTMYKIIHEVCRVILDCLEEEFVSFPQNEEDWLNIAYEFLNQFHFPHCLGPVDSKDFGIYAPPNSGVRFKGRKKKNSVRLMATCDAYRRFT